MCVSLRSSIKGLGGSEGSVQDLSCCLLGSNLWCWPGICWRNSSSLGVTVSNAPITIRTTLNLTFHICSSCSFSTWHPWLCLLSSAFRSTSHLTLVVCDTFLSQMFFQCCWVSALSGSALVLLFPVDERTPWMDLQRTGPLLLWFISSASWLCLSQCYGHLFVTQGLSLMETLCTSVNQLTSFRLPGFWLPALFSTEGFLYLRPWSYTRVHLGLLWPGPIWAHCFGNLLKSHWMLLLMLLHKCKYEKFRCSSFNMRGSDRGFLVLCFPATHSGVQTFCTANINTKK